MKRNPRAEDRLRRLVLATQLQAAQAVAGLFSEPGAPGHNQDAKVPWKQASTRTRAALILTQGAMAAERARRQAPTTQVFGMVLMQPRVESHEAWERMAAAPPAKVIEAEAAPAEPAAPDPQPKGT